MSDRFAARLVIALLIAAGCCGTARAADAPAGNLSPDAVAIKFRFGMKDTDAADWSGKLTLSAGKVESIRGWRWMPGDHADGAEFTVNTRRQQPQSSADRARVQAGGKMPMNDNGIVATLTGVKGDTEITFDAKPGNTTVKLSELPYGERIVKLDGNLMIERAPAVALLAESMADEDYPAVASGKDGTIYLAYLAFTRGKDFQGARERPSTAESGPNTGPLAAGTVKKIEKAADLDYLKQPTGGEVIYLRTYRNGAWSAPVAVTDGKNEYYRPTVAVDGSGKVWVFYSAHLDCDATLDHGNWELLARPFDKDGKSAGEPVNISKARGADFMPAAATDSTGRVWVTCNACNDL